MERVAADIVLFNKANVDEKVLLNVAKACDQVHQRLARAFEVNAQRASTASDVAVILSAVPGAKALWS